MIIILCFYPGIYFTVMLLKMDKDGYIKLIFYFQIALVYTIS